MTFIAPISNNDKPLVHNCSICLGELNKINKTLYCGHIFHINCIDEWLNMKNTCPNCRAFIAQLEPAKVSVTFPNLQTNNVITVNIDNRRTTVPTNHFRKQLIKIIIIVLLVSSILFHFGSSIYNIKMVYRANNHINNYIKTLNETEVGDHNHSTNNADVLVGYDIFYYISMIIIFCNIFTKSIDKCCNFVGCIIILCGTIMVNFLIRDGFMTNTKEYLNDKRFNFDSSYKTDLSSSYIYFISSFMVKIIIMMWSGYCFKIILK